MYYLALKCRTCHSDKRYFTQPSWWSGLDYCLYENRHLLVTIWYEVNCTADTRIRIPDPRPPSDAYRWLVYAIMYLSIDYTHQTIAYNRIASC